MDGVFALVVPVNEDIKIVPGFGGNCDKLLIAAEIVNKGRVPLRRKGCGFFGFLIDNAAVVGRVSGGLLRRVCAKAVTEKPPMSIRAAQNAVSVLRIFLFILGVLLFFVIVCGCFGNGGSHAGNTAAG